MTEIVTMTEQFNKIIADIDGTLRYSTVLTTTGYFSEYLTLLNDMNIDTSHWMDNTVHVDGQSVSDEFLDAIDFEEPILTTDTIIHYNDGWQLKFCNKSSNDTFDPVYTTIQLTPAISDDNKAENEQLKEFLIKMLHRKLVV